LWGILTGTCLSAAPPIHIPIIFPFYLPHFNTPPQNLQSPLGRDVNRLSTRSTPTLRPPHTCHLSSVILKRHSSLTVASSSSRSMAAATFWTCRGHARIRPELPPIVHTHCRGASAARAGPSPSASALLRKHTFSPCGRRTFTTHRHSSPLTLITIETEFDFPFGNTSKHWGARIAHFKVFESWKFFFCCETSCRNAGSRINFSTTFPDSYFYKWVQERPYLQILLCFSSNPSNLVGKVFLCGRSWPQLQLRNEGTPPDFDQFFSEKRPWKSFSTNVLIRGEMNPLHKYKIMSVGYQVKQNLKSRSWTHF